MIRQVLRLRYSRLAKIYVPDVMLITTSVDEISLLVGDSFAASLPEEIKKVLFG